MYTIIKTSHSHLAWLVLAALALVVILSAIAFLGKKNWSASDYKFALIGFILSHLQLLLGLVLYFTSPYGMSNLSGDTMKDSFARLLAVEHPFVNILAIVLITIGYSKGKKLLNTSGAAKTVFIYYGLGLILILSRIPWHVWLD